ncbi:hypothetical protein [[Mycobacterium] crassicus]|uniref:Uncharacterized protein n=1 Tax=[Mycobacterium] crassicus TaxID=2872309 RepID=A0ABU5XDQ9_9MYCO|nr:hypothetical protein [Mycolicibacter sp. MYC098]MEB3020435.1 hypothetical protein [Mycolicibacter sp. MYC098]
MADLPDLRDNIRDEQTPADCLLLRGGPDSTAKLLRHAERMRRMFCLDGDHILGISMFAATDEVGLNSSDGILAGQLSTYRFVYSVPAGVLAAAGFRIVPTFRQPHVTVLIESADELPALLAALGPPQVNGKYGENNHRRRSRDDRH